MQFVVDATGLAAHVSCIVVGDVAVVISSADVISGDVGACSSYSALVGASGAFINFVANVVLAHFVSGVTRASSWSSLHFLAISIAITSVGELTLGKVDTGKAARIECGRSMRFTRAFETDLFEVAGETVALVALVDIRAEGVVDEVASGVATFAFVDLDTVVADLFSSIDADTEESAVIVVAVGISVCVPAEHSSMSLQAKLPSASTPAAYPSWHSQLLE